MSTTTKITSAKARVSPHDEVYATWRRDPDDLEAHAELADEFALVAQMIRARKSGAPSSSSGEADAEHATCDRPAREWRPDTVGEDVATIRQGDRTPSSDQPGAGAVEGPIFAT
jgi:hypothetical protein